MVVDKYFIGNVIDSQIPKYLCLNTNFYVGQDGKAVMVGSVYTLLRQKNANLTQIYGDLLLKKKFGVQLLGTAGSNLVLSFPTRYHWKDQTNINLFKKSCAQLNSLILDQKLLTNIPVYLPIILQNTNIITFDDLINIAFEIINEQYDVHLVACWGNYN